MSSPTPDVGTITAGMSPRQLVSVHLALEHTVALWVGAVSAGKTFASLVAFLLALAKVRRGGVVVIVGRTLDTIHRNVIRPLQDARLFGPVAASVEYTRGASTARILGRDVELIGAPNALAEGRIRGGTFALVYVDEATLLPREFWAMLLTRLREDGSRLLATTNPASRRHWLRIEYIENRAAHDLVVFHLTMRDNPALSAEYIARMARAWTGVFYQRFILGLWTTAEGAVYDSWDPARHVIAWADLPPIERLIAVGIDYGTTNATSAILLGVTDEGRDTRGRPVRRLVLVDEWRHDSSIEGDAGRLAPSEQSRLIRAWLRAPHVPENNPAFGARIPFVFVDPAAADFRAQLSRDGLPTYAAENAVMAGIGSVSSLLADGRLVVADRCAGFIDEVTEYVWDAKASEKGEDAPVKLNDHSLDAARYAIHSTRRVWASMLNRSVARAA